MPGLRWPARLEEEALRATASQSAARADALAFSAAARPLAVLAGLLGANLALAGAFAGAGYALGDQALFFRELMPGTWLSFAQLLFIAAAARAVHVRTRPGEPWHRGFFGISAAIFLAFAFDEITQLSQFAGIALHQGLGLTPAAGFHDLGAVILTLAFVGAGLALLPRAAVLLRHPLTLALLLVAALLGAASQGLDSFVTPTRWEFVAEESFKMAAEAVFAGAYLSALRGVTRTSPRPPRPRRRSRR